QTAAVAAVAGASSQDVSVLFTGRLLGYLRVPDRQAADDAGCPRVGDLTATGAVSDETREFLHQVAKTPHTVLVGAGDNFSPDSFSRIFSPAPLPGQPGKDRYSWDVEARRWVPYPKLTPAARDLIDLGRGTVANDNVGCFLRNA